MTRPFRSVHHTSFLWAFCQELVRSTTHRLVAVTRVGWPFSEQLAIALGWAHHRSMNAYSEDLRKKIVEAKERGMPTVKVARTFGVASPLSSAMPRWLGKGDRCAWSGARADARRPPSAQGSSWRRTCRRDPLPPSRRGASTCGA